MPLYTHLTRAPIIDAEFEIQFFEVEMAYVYRERDGERRRFEGSRRHQYLADGWNDILESGVRAAKASYAQIKGFSDDEEWPYHEEVLDFVCVKIFERYIGVVNEDGRCNRTKSTGCLFEWKYDWPCTLDEQLDSKINKVKRSKTT
jgi:hypothetical protein